MHTELGDLLYHSQDDQLRTAAPNEFQAALAADPRDEKAQLAVGVFAELQGDVKTAYADDSRALQLEPNDSDACTELAKVLIHMSRDDEAQRLLERAVQIDPSNYVPISALARCIGSRVRMTRQSSRWSSIYATSRLTIRLNRSFTICASRLLNESFRLGDGRYAGAQ